MAPRKIKKSKVDTYSYKGWLNSDSFIKRAFAVYGYSIVAGLLIIVPVYAILALFFVLFALVGLIAA